MATRAPVSLPEYLETVYEPDCEYIDGEIVERSTGELQHGGLQGLLITWLLNRRKLFGIHVFPGTRTQAALNRCRVPHIAVTLNKPAGRILREPPFLCIEILSPGDRASRVEEKIDDYLQFGVPYIWLIDPRRKTAWSYTQAGRRQVTTLLTTDDPRIELSLPDLLDELEEELDPA